MNWAAGARKITPLQTEPARTSRQPGTSAKGQSKDIARKDGAVNGAAKPVSLTTQVMKQVVIPASSSSLGSPLSSDRDQSSESDTPATSIAATPVELLPKRAMRRRRRVPVAESVPMNVEGKRKRTAEDNLLVADKLLAQTFQEKEWEADGSSTSVAKRQRLAVDKFDEEDASLDEGISRADSDSEVSLFLNKFQVRSPKNCNATRTAASRKHAYQAHGPILDSDEDELTELSDESAFTMDEEDLDDSDGFDDIDEQGDDNRSGVDTETASANASSGRGLSGLSATTVHRRPNRRRPGRRNNTTPRCRMQRLESRAERERKKLEKAHPEILHMWENLKSVPKIKPSEAAQPSTITRRLKSFQLEGLDWMTKQEASQWKGGLLGDEMGMGKTIQAVSLIMSDYPPGAPTLVVVPAGALMQWEYEIGQYTDGKLKVLVYHNTNPKFKNLKLKDLRGFDVIMISYSGLESIHRKESKGWKRDDGLVKENSKIHAIHYHRLILDEAHNIKTRTTTVAKA